MGYNLLITPTLLALVLLLFLQLFLRRLLFSHIICLLARSMFTLLHLEMKSSPLHHPACYYHAPLLGVISICPDTKPHNQVTVNLFPEGPKEGGPKATHVNTIFKKVKPVCLLCK